MLAILHILGVPVIIPINGVARGIDNIRALPTTIIDLDIHLLHQIIRVGGGTYHRNYLRHLIIPARERNAHGRRLVDFFDDI